MKGWFGSRKSRVRRTSLDFHYDLRPSLWHRIAERSHLIVAGVGSIAMLGMAGTAIWMALPSDGSEQIVSRVEAAPQVAAADAAAEPMRKVEAPRPSEPVSAVSQPDGAKPTAAPAAAAPAVQVASSATDEISIPQPMQIEPLDPTDPRWINATAGHATANATAAANAEASKTGAQPSMVANAYAADDSPEDPAATAAIPAVKPDAKKPAQAAEEGAAEEDKTADAGRAGRTSRAVTMRARPNSRGGVLGTVPGSTNVQVVSCDQWCEIIYKGRRGFVYKSFLRNNGR